MADAPITSAHIHAATWSLALHARMQGGSYYQYSCPSIPELALTKSRRKGKLEQQLHVGDQAIPFPPLEAAIDHAAMLINRARRQKAEAAEWEAAAPTVEAASG
jgi:hypothetical protein